MCSIHNSILILIQKYRRAVGPYTLPPPIIPGSEKGLITRFSDHWSMKLQDSRGFNPIEGKISCEWSPEEEEKRAWVEENNSFSFLTTRHPLERLLSAYRYAALSFHFQSEIYV